jgi:nucleotide-binding universal stress UspA family protein
VSRVVAAIDNSAAAGPVLAAAKAMAELFPAQVDALYVEDGGADGAAAAAAAAGVRLRVQRGPVERLLAEALEAADVVTGVVGARRTPSGPRPAGSTCLQIVTSARKPIVVVPPQSRYPRRLHRVLAPQDASLATASAIQETIDLFHGAAIDVVVLHVHTEIALPAFSDQPHHEVEAWTQEFLRRYCTRPDLVTLELRVGVPSDQVLAVAADMGADMIILGWRQNLGVGRAELVRTVLERSPRPVLLLPIEAG